MMHLLVSHFMYIYIFRNFQKNSQLLKASAMVFGSFNYLLFIRRKGICSILPVLFFFKLVHVSNLILDFAVSVL